MAYAERETILIDFGQPDARRHLVSGWSKDVHRGRHGLPVVWGVGDRSILEFHLVEPREAKLFFQCMPLRTAPASHMDDRPDQVLYIDINGEKRKLKLKPFRREYEFSVPERALREGRNRVRFRYGYSEKPRGTLRDLVPGSALGVEWEYLKLTFAPTVSEVRADPGEGLLYIPFGRDVSYYVELSKRNEFVYERLDFPNGRGTLRLIISRDHHDDVALALAPSTSLTKVDLVLNKPVVARLSFEMATEEGAARSGGALLKSPRLRLATNGVGEFTEVRQVEYDKSIKATEKPNVIIYLVDTLRADHLGCYGYEKPISPNIDAFAEDGVVFENTFASAPWTKPSVASIFTGTSPQHHGVLERDDVLPEDAETLAGILSSRGYKTAAFVTNINVSRPFGFGTGFSDFCFLREDLSTVSVYKKSDIVNREVFSWLVENHQRQPFLLYIHTMDPHSPYAPPEGYRHLAAKDVPVDAINTATYEGKRTGEGIEQMRGLYDAEIAHNDHSFGILMDKLRGLGLYDDALIVFVADHGEEFGEHGGFDHGKTFYREVMHVPLVIKLPAGSIRLGRVSKLAGLPDILPTILDYLGMDVPTQVEGTSLLEKAGGTPSPVLSHLDFDGLRGASIALGPWTLSKRGTHTQAPELYHRIEDPTELKNVHDEYPIMAGYLNSLLEAHARAKPYPDRGTRGLDAEFLRRLRALGYLK